MSNREVSLFATVILVILFIVVVIASEVNYHNHHHVIHPVLQGHYGWQIRVSRDGKECYWVDYLSGRPITTSTPYQLGCP